MTSYQRDATIDNFEIWPLLVLGYQAFYCTDYLSLGMVEGMAVTRTFLVTLCVGLKRLLALVLHSSAVTLKLPTEFCDYALHDLRRPDNTHTTWDSRVGHKLVVIMCLNVPSTVTCELLVLLQKFK
jgi:hypothetical protein